MTNKYINIFLITLFFTILFSQKSFASNIYWAGESSNGNISYGITPLEACTDFFNTYVEYRAGRYVVESFLPGCYINGIGNFDSGVDHNGTCPSGYSDDGNGQCIENPPCTQGEQLADQYLRYPLENNLLVHGECQVEVTSCDSSQSIVVDGIDTTFAKCHLQTTGVPAEQVTNPNLISQETKPDNTCNSNQQGGTFNGQFICINKSDGKMADTTPQKTTTENTTSTGKVDNGDGTSTETITKTINRPDGTKTIETTSKVTDNSTGEQLSSNTTKDDQGDEGGSFSDNGCGVAPRCTGDAVQCAIAKMEHDRNCMLDPPDPSEINATSLGISADLQEVPEGDSFSLSDQLDTSSFLPSSCPEPRTVTVMGQVVTFSYAPFCDLAATVGDFVVIGAALLSLRIIGAS